MSTLWRSRVPIPQFLPLSCSPRHDMPAAEATQLFAPPESGPRGQATTKVNRRASLGSMTNAVSTAFRRLKVQQIMSAIYDSPLGYYVDSMDDLESLARSFTFQSFSKDQELPQAACYFILQGSIAVRQHGVSIAKGANDWVFNASAVPERDLDPRNYAWSYEGYEEYKSKHRESYAGDALLSLDATGGLKKKSLLQRLTGGTSDSRSTNRTTARAGGNPLENGGDRTSLKGATDGQLLLLTPKACARFLGQSKQVRNDILLKIIARRPERARGPAPSHASPHR